MKNTNLDWRKRIGGAARTTPAPVTHGGTRKYGGTTTVGKTKVGTDFMTGKGGGSGRCNLQSYAQRRVGHGKK